MIQTANEEQNRVGSIESVSGERILRICNRGHEVTTVYVYFRKDGFAECKKCRNLATRRHAKSPERTLTEEKARRVLEALHNGDCLRLIHHGIKGNVRRNKARYVQPPICSSYELRNFRDAHPKFDAIVTELAAKNEAAARSHRYGNRSARKFPSVLLRSKRGSTSAVQTIQQATRNLCPTLRAP